MVVNPQMGMPMDGPRPMLGTSGQMTPMQQGLGYDQYMPMIRERIRRRPMPGLRLPKAPPRFPTPGRMDGTRDYPQKYRTHVLP